MCAQQGARQGHALNSYNLVADWHCGYRVLRYIHGTLQTLAGSGGSNGKGGAGIGGAAEVPGQQGGLWANIHLLCDLLGGPLGQVGKLTVTECDTKNKQEDNSSSK